MRQWRVVVLDVGGSWGFNIALRGASGPSLTWCG